MAVKVSKKSIRYGALCIAAAAAVWSGIQFRTVPDGGQPDLAMQAGFAPGGAVTVELLPAPGDAAPVQASLGLEPILPPLPAMKVPMLPADVGLTDYASQRQGRAGEHPPAPVVTRVETNPAQGPISAHSAQTGIETDGCTPQFQVSPADAGRARLAIDAPCHAGRRVMLGHAALAIDVELPENGRIAAALPVLDATQPFTATLDDGLSAQARLLLPNSNGFAHVVLQWQGEAGLQLHAREAGAAYGETGHIWYGNPKGAARTLDGEGGFLTRLGDPSAGGVADVYSYPTGMADAVVDVALTVEAEVTDRNCASDVAGQLIQPAAGEVVVLDIGLAMPDCDALGDILVLKNAFQGLKIAAN